MSTWEHSTGTITIGRDAFGQPMSIHAWSNFIDSIRRAIAHYGGTVVREDLGTGYLKGFPEETYVVFYTNTNVARLMDEFPMLCNIYCQPNIALVVFED